ncbi:MAG: hypothetical protein DRR00_31850, partial [Candidatus Parabeggiatoa sp. nov. 3]
MAGLLATVPVASTTGASSLKSPASIWRGVVFIALIVGMMAMGRGAWAFSCSDVTEIPKTECEALVDLYNSTDGANWGNNTGWNVTNTPCSWYGISCKDGHVTELSPGSSQLSGSIPESLGNLSNLSILALRDNQLSGSIPESLGNLSNLTWLDLARNQLSGSIPESLGNLSNLKYLILRINQLSGSIPESLGNLSNLINLNLGWNPLGGSIPSSFGNLSNLQNIGLQNNQLSGSIPESFGNLSNLTGLWLQQNKLCGDLPLSLMNLKLNTINISNNHLTVSEPEQIAWLNNIQTSVWGSQTPCPTPKFSCSDVTEIPKTECEALVDLYNSTDGANWTNNSGWNETNTPCSWYGVECSDGHVTTITLGKYSNGNQLSGSIPESLGDLSNLRKLWLDSNQLSGSIPESLGNLSNLSNLWLSKNQLSGSIPESLSKLSILEYLVLDRNQLSGSIPDSLSSLSNLIYLDLDSNQLSGSIPESLGDLSNLELLQLNDNQLSGSIPESLGNLSSDLEFLELGNNQLSGSIPESLGNLSDLRTLFLNSNQLSGSIPESLDNLMSHLGLLYLYNNELCGEIPLSLMNLSHPEHLRLYNNHLTASDPDLIAWLNDNARWENQTPCPTPKLATTPPPSICNGDSFDVTFKTVIEESQSVDTVTINLGFDPATLKFNSLTNSGVLDFEMTNKHDNGSIEFTAGVWDNPVQTQTFDMFTVNFTALQATETTLTYDTSQSSLTSEGESIPYFAENGQLTLSNCFGYQVDLQRKTPKPDSSWETALEISIGTQTNATKYTSTCDENGQGNIAIEGTLGNEDYICVKNAHTLANKIEAPIDIGNIVDFGSLLEGDANGDNMLNINDFSLVFASRKKCTGDTGYNANVDFDVSGCIDGQDANFLKSPPIGNLGKTSACTWNSSLSMLRRGRGTRDGKSAVTLGTTAIPTGLTVGDTFDYVIKVQAGTQFVDTASAYLNFDPKLLKVNTILQGETFDFVLQSSFDNELGNIDFAAGVWDNEVPKDTFTLVTINFTVLKV